MLVNGITLTYVKNLNLENQLIFCEKYSISPNELLLLEIILIAQEGDDDDLVHKYFRTRLCARGSIVEMLKVLQEVKIIHKNYNIPKPGESLNLETIPLNKTVVKDFYRSSYEMGKELFESYPISTVVNGIEYKLRRVSKKFNSLEDAFRSYGKAIRWKPEAHKRVLELIKQGKDRNYSFTTLDDFIVDHDWLNMEALTKEGILTNSNMRVL